MQIKKRNVVNADQEEKMVNEDKKCNNENVKPTNELPALPTQNKVAAMKPCRQIQLDHDHKKNDNASLPLGSGVKSHNETYCKEWVGKVQYSQSG